MKMLELSFVIFSPSQALRTERGPDQFISTMYSVQGTRRAWSNVNIMVGGIITADIMRMLASPVTTLQVFCFRIFAMNYKFTTPIHLVRIINAPGAKPNISCSSVEKKEIKTERRKLAIQSADVKQKPFKTDFSANLQSKSLFLTPLFHVRLLLRGLLIDFHPAWRRIETQPRGCCFDHHSVVEIGLEISVDSQSVTHHSADLS